MSEQRPTTTDSSGSNNNQNHSSSSETPPPPPPRRGRGRPRKSSLDGKRKKKTKTSEPVFQDSSSELDVKPTTVSERRPKKKQSNPTTTMTTTTHETTIQPAEVRVRGPMDRVVGTLLGLVLWPIKWTMVVILPHTMGAICGILVLVVGIYLVGSTMKGLLEPVTSLVVEPLRVLVQPLSTLTVSAVYVYCTVLRGPFCGREEARLMTAVQVGQVARAVSGTAQQAADIFDSVVQLSDPTHLGLHQAEILELAFAVRWSSDLPDKILLADGLNELSLLTRDLKDQLLHLNAKGLNTFSFIAFQFSRLGDLIEWVQSGKKEYTRATIEQNLEILFEDLTGELSRLLSTIEAIIPLGYRSTDLGSRISERLYHQHYQLLGQKSRQSLWKKLANLASFDGRQLRHDLDLTALSINNLKDTWMKLENIRTDLLTYRNNVASFKASFTAWHLADHGLTPEDELTSMRAVIERFQETLKSVKAKGATAPSTGPNRISPS